MANVIIIIVINMSNPIFNRLHPGWDERRCEYAKLMVLCQELARPTFITMPDYVAPLEAAELLEAREDLVSDGCLDWELAALQTLCAAS